MDRRCIYCQASAFEKKIAELPIGKNLKKSLIEKLNENIESLDEKTSAPELAAKINRMLMNATQNRDPYFCEKKAINNYLMDHYNKYLSEVESSFDPFNKALRLCIAGNIIDNIASPDFNVDETISRVMSSEFKIDHSGRLFNEIQYAESILYLGDNAGEIVFDKLFIEILNHPNILFAVRGKPVINDATVADAQFIGLNNVVKVISNGSDAPSTLLNDVSKEFLKIYQQADLVIAKGQGNFEGLMNETHKNIYFLFMVKCDVIAELIGAAKGDFVVLHNSYVHNIH